MTTKLAGQVLPTLRLFRIASLRHKIFDGTGAAIVGGRWNHLGVAVIYTSTSLAGARLELLAHIGFVARPRNYGYVEIDVPELTDVEIYKGGIPISFVRSKDWGSDWQRAGNTLLGRVPSIASPGDFNYLINPSHPSFSSLVVSSVRPAKWDSRHFS
jgi:RES domain-containing protein